MKVLLARFLNEPAVAIGAIFSAFLFFTASEGGLTTSEVTTSLAPLLSALGIRQVVTPAKRRGPKDEGNVGGAK
jgi:hypothetical protein